MTRTGVVAALGVVLGMIAAEQTAAANRMVAAPLSWRVLATHNAERARWRVPAMQWDPGLAAAADAYAAQLAVTGRWGHSPRAARPGQGENLWMGTRGYFTPEQMVGGWLSEGRMFRAGVFPQVSRTGNWSDVGHYSQVIWRGTTKVGCAIRSNRSNDYLVCRYSPNGNVDGRSVA
ncbi:CAP domain-containing protein [Sphingomonas sp. BN140010]|uniref:CAP domain-containing protein n=1 Tax=Sphingomonas arvum TaxID=2992113 RepID=A0ABT3JEC7_9SPHN|nr:CAP domain-containing protein [Sphingomonas sp. BN140010]MCW3797427.1 CAP domain-containing protein [Sphingomonas sp. BN140010]